VLHTLTGASDHPEFAELASNHYVLNEGGINTYPTRP
jgi:hypothetical protein